VADVISHAKITTLLLPGIGTVHDLKAAFNAGARVVRIVIHHEYRHIGSVQSGFQQFQTGPRQLMGLIVN